MEDGFPAADVVDLSFFSLGWMELASLDELLGPGDFLLSVDFFKELCEGVLHLLALGVGHDLNNESVFL